MKVRAGDRALILAAALRETLEQKLGHSLPVEESLSGDALLGLRYHPPFEHFKQAYWDKDGALSGGGREAYLWKVLSGDFVTLDSGTAWCTKRPPSAKWTTRCTRNRRSLPRSVGGAPALSVRPDGTFDDDVTEVAGQWVKQADRMLIRMLRDSGPSRPPRELPPRLSVLLARGRDPLIQYARPAWFVRTTARNREVLANNDRINCFPSISGPDGSATSCATTSTGRCRGNATGDTPQRLDQRCHRRDGSPRVCRRDPRQESSGIRPFPSRQGRRSVLVRPPDGSQALDRRSHVERTGEDGVYPARAGSH